MAVGGFITFWFEGQEELQEPTAMQVAIAEAKSQQDRLKSPEASGRARRKKGKSRAELENAKRPFAFRTDPVNLAFGEIKTWGDIPGLAEERGYRPWDEVAKGEPDDVLHAGADVGIRQWNEEDDESVPSTPAEYKAPSDDLCPVCKLVPPTAPKENVMGKTVFDGMCDFCAGRVVAKKKTERMPTLDMGTQRRKKKEPEENPWVLPKEEAEKFEKRSASVMGTVTGGVLNGGTKLVVANGRRSGSVSPSRMGGGSSGVDDGSSPPGPNAKPRLGRNRLNKAPPRGEAQGGDANKLHRTMANWGAGAAIGVEKGYPVNWPSAYPDIGLPFTSDVPVTKKALIKKLTDTHQYT